MKLLCELNQNVGNIVTESVSTGEKQYFIEGVFIQTNIVNKNRRRYPLEVMQEEVKSYVEEKVKNNMAYGELDHFNSMTVNIKNASHLITELYQDGNDFIGKAKILNTQMGIIVKNIIDDGGRFGSSTRGAGEMKKVRHPSGTGIITEVVKYKMATAGDIVSDPSAPNALMEAIMENSNWIYDIQSNEWIEEKDVNLIKESFTNQRASTISPEQKLKAYQHFFNSLKTS